MTILKIHARVFAVLTVFALLSFIANTSAIAIDPNDAQAYNNRGLAYNNKGNMGRG